MQSNIDILVMTPAGICDSSLAIAAARSGACGVLDLEFATDVSAALAQLKRLKQFAGNSSYAIKISSSCSELVQRMVHELPRRLSRVVVAGGYRSELDGVLDALRAQGVEILWEAINLDEAIDGQSLGINGLILKGNEAAGRVGQETAFILLQRWQHHANACGDATLPVWVQGGIGPNTAAACALAGAAGVVLDGQVLLARESPLSELDRQWLAGCDGSETILVGERLGEIYRVHHRHGNAPVVGLAEEERRLEEAPDSPIERTRAWRSDVLRLTRPDSTTDLWLLGQDVALAKSLAERHVTVGGIVRALRESVVRNLQAARRLQPLAPGAPLAQSHGTRYPIVQGPMGRVSDTGLPVQFHSIAVLDRDQRARGGHIAPSRFR